MKGGTLMYSNKNSYNGSSFYHLKHHPNRTKVCGHHPTFGDIEFNMAYGSHTFDSDEICELLKGNSVKLITGGWEFTGKLAKKTYRGYEFIGYQPISSTKVFKDESFGYVLIYCEEVTEKEKLEDVKSQIIEVLSNKLDQEDEYLYYKAVFELRRKYKLEFQDTELAKAYKTFTSKYETK